jgi:uracil-DNA glycosylase
MWNLQHSRALESPWDDVLDDFFESSTGRDLQVKLAAEATQHSIYPTAENVFRALHLTAPSQVRVVILGQDPYHGAGQADGLAFSVPQNVPAPPSLRNILKELREDLQVTIPVGFQLSQWANQGVLLLNTTLTVRQEEAGSHREFGWNLLTDRIIQQVNDRSSPTVFVLWGKDAQTKLPLINANRHFAMCSPHPSPLSAHRGFLGSKPFSRANQFLLEKNRSPVAWI